MNEAYSSLFGIFISLAFVVFLVFKGYSILAAVPVAAAIICVFSGESIYAMLSEVYMRRFSSFASMYYLIFLLSAIFGKLMGDCGAAKCIATRVAAMAKRYPGREKLLAIYALVLIQGGLAYGGISGFVVVFTMVPIGKNLFEELDVPWCMYTCLSLATSTFSMTMLPGLPSIHNLIPTQYLGTTPSAAPVLGILSSIFAIVVGFVWIERELRRRERNGEGFFPSGEAIAKNFAVDDAVQDLPLFPCLLPSIVLLAVMNIFGQHPVTALASAIVATLLLFWKRIPDRKGSFAAGAANAYGAMLNTCSMAGYGGVVATVSGYRFIVGGLDRIPGPPIIQLVAAIAVASCVSGSGSAGLAIGMESFSQHFLNLGLKPEIIHRIASMSCAGFDVLPHNSAISNTLSVTRLGFKYGYRNMFIFAGVIPVLCTVFGVFLAQLGVE